MKALWIGRLYSRRAGLKHRMLAWPLALAIVIAIHVVSALLIQRLHLNNSPEVYYASDSPAMLLRDALRRDFPNDEVLTVIFQGKDLYGREFLARMDRFAARLRVHPLVDRVTTVTSLEKISGTGDGFSVERLLDPSKSKNQSQEAARQRVLSDRFAPGMLASRDGTALAVAVRPKPLSESAERVSLMIAVASAVNAEGLRDYYAGNAGPVSIDVAQLESVLSDSKIFVPITAVIGLLLLGWVVGRLRPVVIGAVAMSTVILPTLAAVAVSGQPYTMATAILPSLLAAYTLATLLHLYAGFQRAQLARLKRAHCVDRALSETLKSGTYNVLTTGAGLLSMVLVSIPPIQVFGIAGAWGTFLVFVTVFFLVPPFLAHWDKRRWPREASGMSKLGRVASKLTIFSMRHPKAMVATAVLSLAAAFPLAQQVSVESDVLAFFKPDHPVSRHTRLIESKLSGVTSLEISLVGEGRDSLQNVATLRGIREFQRWLEQLPEVDRSVSMADVVEEMHWAMNGEKPAFRAIPGNDRLLRQYLLVYDGQDLYELVNRDFQHARIVLSLNVHGAKEIGASIDRMRQRLISHPIAGLKADIGGYGRLFADQVDLLVSGQINSFAGAFLQIFVFMAILWRSFSASALCLIPNLAPLYFIFVAMGAFGVHLDLATVMIAGVVLGITVDDTIHLYHGYLHRRKKGVSPVFAIARSFESSGRAVMAISLLLVTQFALLMTSDFVPTANFGLMTAVGLFSGQVFELLLLPALLVLKDVRKVEVGASQPSASHTRAIASDTAGTGQSRPKSEEADWPSTQLFDRSAAEMMTPAMPPSTLSTVAPLAGHASSQMVRRVLVCQGEACRAAGASAIAQQLHHEQLRLKRPGAQSTAAITQTSCLGLCELAAVVQVFPEGIYFHGDDQAHVVRNVQTYLAGQIAAKPESVVPAERSTPETN